MRLMTFSCVLKGSPSPPGTSISIPGSATIPLGQSVLMIIPTFEQHSLGAFVAADNLRRHGIWVHMAFALEAHEIAELITHNRFMMVGLSLATSGGVEKTTVLVEYLRAKIDHVPPIVVGGAVVVDRAQVQRRTGADFAVKSAREAIEKCGLSTVGVSLGVESAP